MDIQLTAILSVVEIMAFAGPRGVAELAHKTPVTLASTFVSYFLIQYALVKFYRIIIYPLFLSPLRNLPGPKDNIPMLGQFIAMFNASRPFELPVKWANMWPQAPFIRFLGLLNGELLVMNTPEAHKAVLQTHCYDFIHPELERRAVGEFAGEGLFFAAGAEHRRLRKLLINTLGIPALKRLMPVFRAGCTDLTNYLNQEIGDRGQTYIDVGAVLSKATLDLAGMTILGTKLDNLKSKDPRFNFSTHYHRIMDQGTLSALITMINTAVPVRKFLPIEANLGYMNACNEIKRLTLECVVHRSAEIAGNKKLLGDNHIEIASGGRDMLTLMIEDRRTFMGTDKEMTDVEIADMLLAFIVGGHETTASSLLWAVYVMVTKPEVQETLRREIIDFITKNPNYGYYEVESLPYLTNFSRELFRTYCAVIGSYREAAHDLTICDIFIPKGTVIYYLPSVTNFSRTLWGPTAEEFIPERWEAFASSPTSEGSRPSTPNGSISSGNPTSTSNGNKKEAPPAGVAPAPTDPYSYMSFSHGPRTCPGKHYGNFEFKLLLIELLANFRFGMSPELEKLGGKLMRLQNPAPTLRPKGGLRVSVEKLVV